MADITPDQAQEALRNVEHARRHVADAVGLPAGYWWAMAGGWLVLGVLGAFASPWLAGAATLAFGIGHSMLASRVLDGRHPHPGLQVSESVAGRRAPWIVIGILVASVAVTIGLGFALDADGARHAGIWAAVIVAVGIGFGGSTMFAFVRNRFMT